MKRVARRLPTAALAVALAAPLVLGPAPAARALAVFDGANYSQNLLTAVRTLQMIDNQIRQLQNEALMLENMARNLAHLDYSSLDAIETALRQINLLMARAEGIAFDVAAAETELARLFPRDYAATVTGDALAREARQRWSHAMDGFRQTMLVQAEVVSNVEADTETLARLVVESQAAIGSLQASQATNQLIALSAKQQLQTQELMAAQYRAEALDAARAAQAEEQARVQLVRFLGDGQAYTPDR
jgi:P-type conjugative transfer protein TrbJ